MLHLKREPVPRRWSVAVVLLLLLVTACTPQAARVTELPPADVTEPGEAGHESHEEASFASIEDESSQDGASSLGGADEDKKEEGCSLSGEITLGGVVSMSGVGEHAGRATRRGIELGAEQINSEAMLGPDATVEVIFEDDESDAARAIEVTERLINELKPLALIGPSFAESAFAVADLAAAYRVPMLIPSPSVEGINARNEFVFRTSLSESNIIPLTLNAVKTTTGAQSVMILYSDDNSYTRSSFEVMQQAATNQGLEILGIEKFPVGTRDFTPQLSRIKEIDPDIVMVSALAEDAAVVLLQKADMKLRATFVGNNSFNSPRLGEIAGWKSDLVVFGATWFQGNLTPENAAFIKAYRKKFGLDPDQAAAQGYTSMLVLAEGLQAACQRDRDAIREGLSSVSLLSTPLGTFSFTSTRDPLYPPVILINREGSPTMYGEGNY